MKPPKPKWTPEEEAELLRLRDQLGLRFGDIGERLGRTRSACANAYWRIKRRRETMGPLFAGLEQARGGDGGGS